MEITPATPNDAKEIAAIWNRQIESGIGTFASVQKSVEDIIAIINERQAAGHGFLIARLEGVLAGFATYSQFRAGNGYAKTMEHTINLYSTAQGKGVGRALMKALEQHARAFGAHSMFAGVSAENEAGIAFHASLGYREVARLPEVGYKFDRWFDLVLMQKFL